MKLQNQKFIVHFLTVAACMSVATGAVNAGGRVDVDIDFTTDFNYPATTDPYPINNPYWPLMPGTIFVYWAVEGDECFVNEVAVTYSEKNDFDPPYDNITAVIVDDNEWEADCDTREKVGEPLESTEDWYAQDKYGHIWYFGEATTDYTEAPPSSEGSWEAGSDVAGIGSNAEPGIIMLAFPATETDGSVVPAPGLFYEQEYYEDEAQDMGKVKRLNTKVALEMENTLADSEYTGCLKIKEWTPLSPGAVEFKYYCPYVGLVLIEELQGGPTVRVELTDINP